MKLSATEISILLNVLLYVIPFSYQIR